MSSKTLIALMCCLLLAATSTLASANLDATQLAGWKDFHKRTSDQNTQNWNKCKGKRNTPCTCTGAAAATVTCAEEGDTTYITSINLQSNVKKSRKVPEEGIEQMISASPLFTSIVMNEKLTIRNGGTCLNIPSCHREGVTCEIGENGGLPLCEAPATTEVPSASPTKGDGGLVTTVEPTMMPTSMAPSSSPPSASPSTKAPTNDGDTSAPTASPTASPSEMVVEGTNSPTDDTPMGTDAPVVATATPTAGTGGSTIHTSSPTSFAVTLQASTAAFSVLLCSLVAAMFF